MADFSVKFVSQKISRIRWKPKQNKHSSGSTTFATGTWDDGQNTLCLWQLEDRISSSAGEEHEVLEHEPQKIFEAKHHGDVTDMEYASPDLLVIASSTGDVTLKKHKPENQEMLITACSWKNIHFFENGESAPCTCVASRGDDWISTGGEDGRLAVLAYDRNNPIFTIDDADSCSINDMIFLKHNEVLSVNSFGQLKTFDLRQDTKKEAQIFSVTEGHTPLLCVDKHPGQAHIVATGGEDGMLTIWDLRKEKFPMTLLEAHTGAMWEVKFHPRQPNHLFTCSDDGSLWHWDGSAFSESDQLSNFSGLKGKNENEATISSPWLTLETSQQKLDIASLLPNKSLPVNSLDIESSTVLCGTDSETIYSIKIPMLM